MNRTLLLIICDFLLLNLLALTRWDSAEPEASRQPPVPAVAANPASASEDMVAAMRTALEDRIPGLAGEELATATCIYTMTPDQHFIIAPHAQYPQVTTASPCSGHGYKFASVIGEILADLAIDGSTRHPIDLFRADRFHVS